jgi:hypothetical protein
MWEGGSHGQLGPRPCDMPLCLQSGEASFLPEPAWGEDDGGSLLSSFPPAASYQHVPATAAVSPFSSSSSSSAGYGFRWRAAARIIRAAPCDSEAAGQQRRPGGWPQGAAAAAAAVFLRPEERPAVAALHFGRHPPTPSPPIHVHTPPPHTR